MKIGEKFLDDDGGKFVVQETHDFNPTLEAAKGLREVTNNGKFGESRLVARIPGKLVSLWMKEAGVSPTDTHAVQELMRKKLMDPEFKNFRVWEGAYNA